MAITPPPCRVPAEEPWNPRDILVDFMEETNPVLGAHYGKERFRLEASTLASVYPELFTPDAQHPYRGVWIGEWVWCINLYT